MEYQPAGNRHYESIKSLYDAGKLQILEPGEEPKFSDIAQDYLNIDGQNLYTDFTFDLLTSDTAVVESDVVDDASPDLSLFSNQQTGLWVK